MRFVWLIVYLQWRLVSWYIFLNTTVTKNMRQNKKYVEL